MPTAYRLRGINPNWVTAASLLLGLGASVAGWQHAYPLGLALWVLSKLADGLDGTLARIRNQQSDLGGYLDILSDSLLWALVPLGLALGQPLPSNLISFGLLLVGMYLNAGSWMYLAALMEKRQQGAKTTGEMTTITMPIGLMEGTESILVYSAFFIFPTILFQLFLLMASLALLTTLIRLFWAVRHL